MNHQKKLMKDWSLERQATAMDIVSCNFRLFKKYSPEELMKLALSNRDAFDLFGAILLDMANEKVPIADKE